MFYLRREKCAGVLVLEQPINKAPCETLYCLFLAFEVYIGEDIDFEYLEFFRRAKGGQGFVVEIFNNRPNGEGSYCDAPNTWGLYAAHCIKNRSNNDEEFCEEMLDLVVERFYRYLRVFGNMNLGEKHRALEKIRLFIQDVLVPLCSRYPEYCGFPERKIDYASDEYFRIALKVFDDAWNLWNSARQGPRRQIYRGLGDTAFFKLLHAAFHVLLPPFDNFVCALYRSDKRGHCSGVKSAYELHLRAINLIAKKCRNTSLFSIAPLCKPFTKVIDEAMWLWQAISISGDSVFKRNVSRLLQRLSRAGLCPVDVRCGFENLVDIVGGGQRGSRV